MTKRIVVTGATGFVAGSVLTQGAEPCELHAVSRGDPLDDKPQNVNWHRVEFEDAAELTRTLEKIRPEAVIHTAAIANIDYCEAHQEEAYNANAGMTQTLADYCAQTAVKLVFCSTDNIYDGEKGLYAEDDPPNSLNYYGATKLEAERIIARPETPWTACRVALVMGLPVLGRGNSFLSRMLDQLEAGEKLGVPDTEIRSPIDVITLGAALLELAHNDYTGYLQLGGNDAVNRHEMAQRIARRLGYDPGRIVPNNPEHLPGRAPRPRDASLNNALARRVLKTPTQDIEGGIDLVMEAKAGHFPAVAL